MGELKPCPLCNSPALLERDNDHHGAWFNLGCSVGPNHAGDGACILYHAVYTEDAANEAETVLAWNTRPRTEGRGEDRSYALVRRIGRLTHAADEGFDALEEDLDGLQDTLNGLIAEARDIMASHPIREPEISKAQLVELIMRETTDEITENGLVIGCPNVLVQGCTFIRGHQRGYERPEEAARGFAELIADAILNLASVGGRGEEWTPTHRHVQRGSDYQVLGEAELQVATAAPLEGHHLVVYRDQVGKLWARAAFEFHDGRFSALGASEQFAENAKKSTASGRELRTAVVLHLDTDGTPTLKVWDPAGEVLALWIDEAAPGDRVYEWTTREPDLGTLRELIGTDRVGNARDGYLDDQTVQAIRAAFWRRDGGQLTEVEEGEGS